MPAKTKTPARRTSRTGRSSTGKLASFTDAPSGPLTPAERSELFDLIDDAHGSNHRLLTAARELEEAREAFTVAKQNLEIAEADLVNERAENQRIHVKLAPLFKRLPA